MQRPGLVTLACLLLLSCSRAGPMLPPTPAAAPPRPAGLAPLMPDSPGLYPLVLHAQLGDQPLDLPCRVFLPTAYDKNKEPCPLLLYLHDQKERGSDLAALDTTGPLRLLRQDPNWRANVRCIVAAPQCPAPASWDDPRMARALLFLLDELGRNYRIDPDRVYLMGAGMGGAGVWRVALEAPQRFAAAAVSSSAAVLPDTAGARLKHMPIYLTASPNDKDGFAGYTLMAEALGNARATVQATRLGNSRDECVAQFSAPGGGAYDWLVAQKRRTDQQRRERDASDAAAERDRLAHLPTTPGHHKLQWQGWVGDQNLTIPYMLYLPKDYDHSAAACPLLLFFHGGGEANPDLSGVLVHGPGPALASNQVFRNSYPFIGVYPICDGSPERIKGVVRVLDEVGRHYRVDADRVYAMGLSLGGTNTWKVAMEAPERFAAIVPFCGRAVDPDNVGARLKNLPIWIVVGGNDGDFTVGANKMHDALSKAKADVFLTVIPNEGHFVFERFCPKTAFYDWFLFHQRGQPPSKLRYSAEHLLAIGLSDAPDAQFQAQLKDGFAQFLPYWFLVNCGRTPTAPGNAPDPGPGLCAELNGHKRVFVTAPLLPEAPCLLQTTTAIATGKKTTLHLVVGRHREGQWDLIVRAEGKDLATRPINRQTAPDGWTDVKLDLSGYAGSQVHLELVNKTNGSDRSSAYWATVALETN